MKKDREHPVYGIIESGKKKSRIMPAHEIKRTQLPKEVAKLDIQNLVDVPEDLLKTLLARTELATSIIKDSILLHDIPVILAHDNATSYAEVALRDGLGIDIEIDDDVLHAISQLNRLSLLYQYILMIKLPKKVRKIFIERLATLMAEESLADMKKAVTSRKYSQKLRELTGIVKSRGNTDEEEFVDVEKPKKNKSGVYRSRDKK